MVVKKAELLVENTAPFMDNFVENFVVHASENKELKVGRIVDKETQELVTLKSTKINCDKTQSWI